MHDWLNPSSKYRDLGLLVLRLGFGGAFFWFHGWPKITGGVERWERLGAATGSLGIDFLPVVFGFLAAFAESFGAICFMLGLFFRPAAFLLMLTMIVATTNHFVTGNGTPAHSMKNIFVFLGLLAVGPGKYSIDAMMFGNKK